MMKTCVIRSARVYDPARGVDGQAEDIHITDGRIAAPGQEGKPFNADGLLALPGGIDPHTHVIAASRAPHAETMQITAPSLARLYLTLGYTAFAEAGLNSAALKDLPDLPVQGYYLALDVDGPLPAACLTRKYVGEEGARKFFDSGPDPSCPAPHLHLPGLAKPGGIDRLAGFLQKLNGRPVHLAHLAYYIYGPESDHRPRAAQAAALLSEHPNVTFDLGPVSFGKTFSLTADTELAGRITATNKRPLHKVPGSDYMAVEYHFLHKCMLDSMFWFAGMELLLSLKNFENASLSLDFPSGGPIAGYPFIYACLMNAEGRSRFARRLNKEAAVRSGLLEMKRELTLYELTRLTRSSPAAALGLADRGSLSPGCVADIVFYRPPDGGVEAADAKTLEQMFANPVAVMKDGRFVYGGL